MKNNLSVVKKNKTMTFVSYMFYATCNNYVTIFDKNSVKQRQITQ